MDSVCRLSSPLPPLADAAGESELHAPYLSQRRLAGVEVAASHLTGLVPHRLPHYLAGYANGKRKLRSSI